MQTLKFNLQEAMARPPQDIRDPQVLKKVHAQIIADILKEIQEAKKMRIQRIQEIGKPAPSKIIRQEKP